MKHTRPFTSMLHGAPDGRRSRACASCISWRRKTCSQYLAIIALSCLRRNCQLKPAQNSGDRRCPADWNLPLFQSAPQGVMRLYRGQPALPSGYRQLLQIGWVIRIITQGMKQLINPDSDKNLYNTYKKTLVRTTIGYGPHSHRKAPK